jgi:anti-sigma regulatory factor (Ser/Thr protein kinase)
VGEGPSPGRPTGGPAAQDPAGGRDDPGQALDRCSATVLPATTASVPTARTWVREALKGSGVGADAVRDAELLLSEICANAVRHTTSTHLHLQVRTGPSLEISVRDQDPDGNPRPLHPGPDQESGRGLTIVAALATAWGIRRAADGKTVWFRLDRHG